jgi:hypothetical protein
MRCPSCKREIPPIKEDTTDNLIWCNNHKQFHKNWESIGDGSIMICPGCTELLMVQGNGTSLRTLTDQELFDQHAKYPEQIAASRSIIRSILRKDNPQ